MTDNGTPEAQDAGTAPPETAGAVLARARVEAGMSVEDAAGQLKLAPRQVAAIERDDYASLPGRTFVRGFVRNYARLLKLDVDAVLAALPGEGAAPALERPTLGATSRAIGELPSERTARPSIARWAIPLALAAIVAVAAYYEFARPPAPAPAPGSPAGPAASGGVPLPVPATAPAGDPAPATPPEAEAAPGPGTATTSLPNPLASAPPSGTAAAPPPPSAAGAANQLAVRFRGTSWIEVRDRSGGIVLSMTGTDGTTRELAVAPPGEIVIGNAAVVDASWQGRTLDVAGQSRQNVARLRLE